MIVTCPQCSSRFALPVNNLGEEGKSVKCSDCGEIWYQLPDPDELAALATDQEQGPEDAPVDPPEDQPDEEPFDDIPEGVKPNLDEGENEGSVPPAEPEGGAQRYSIKAIQDLVTGTFPHSLIAAGAIFVLILIILLALNGPVKRAFPSMNAFYGAFGMAGAAPGEGLVFDRLQAKIKMHDGQEILSLAGKIINLTAQDQPVPHIKAVIKDADGQAIDYIMITPPSKIIEKEGVLDFEINQELPQKGAQDVAVRFVLQ